MSRTIVTNSGSTFLTSINSEKLIGSLFKEVGIKFDHDSEGAIMPYDMDEEEVHDACVSLRHLLFNKRYYRFYNKHIHLFEENSSIHTFEEFVSNLITNLKESKGYTCL